MEYHLPHTHNMRLDHIPYHIDNNNYCIFIRVHKTRAIIQHMNEENRKKRTVRGKKIETRTTRKNNFIF